MRNRELLYSLNLLFNRAGATNTAASLTVEFPPSVDAGQVSSEDNVNTDQCYPQVTQFWSWDQRPVTLFCKGNKSKI